jgi:hypothetical protein
LIQALPLPNIDQHQGLPTKVGARFAGLPTKVGARFAKVAGEGTWNS